jgi:hypothetical protein
MEATLVHTTIMGTIMITTMNMDTVVEVITIITIMMSMRIMTTFLKITMKLDLIYSQLPHRLVQSRLIDKILSTIPRNFSEVLAD